MLRARIGPRFLRTCPPIRTGSNLPQHRWHSTKPNLPPSGRRPRLILGFLGGTALLSTSLIYADSVTADPTADSLPALLRAYVVYSMCSIPTLVDNAPALLRLADLPVPGARWLVESLVRATFFNQFVGGDTAQETLPVLSRLRAANKGALFAYSVEVDEAHAMAGTSSSNSADSSPHERIVEEMIRCIDIAADFEDGLEDKGPGARKTWVAVKMSALVPDANALVKLSKHILTSRPPSPIPFPGSPHPSDLDILSTSSPTHPNTGLTPSDLAALRTLHTALRRICTRAASRGVRIIVDAEYTWYQPAIDALTLALTREFNVHQPLVYGTYQAYLRRTPSHLAQALADAKQGGYSLGVKLVRGAYHSHELAAAESSGDRNVATSISPDPALPVWVVKQDTDACYDACVGVLLRAVADDLRDASPASSSSSFWSWWSQSSTAAEEATTPGLGVLFGTHNWTSTSVILDELVRSGLTHDDPNTTNGKVHIPDEVTTRVAMGQLYGMADDLTDYLAAHTTCSTPFVIKYVPYGVLSEVMPYLSRRATENRSVLGEGGAARERARAGREIWRRVRGAVGFGAE
ncbi:hypothetical protein H0H81_009207 [Sphagnurus paluster]|uniref:Proline dehydrogenase n=1 Tax=Sphagnurus paluster TaxID=117069 RepID=A0A9P7GL45_9AGAR|nr:hypothetical protein H0H81_009207 [Sphagnurus paluster]